MSFSIYYLGHFKKGQFDITEDCKSKSDTGKIISIDDGDVTTNIYELPEYFKLDELRAFVAEAYGEGNSSYIATYRTDEEGNIFVFFNGSYDGNVEDTRSIPFVDEDGDMEYWDVFTGDEKELLTTSAYLSVDDVLKERTELKAVLDEIVKKIKAVNDKRLENRECVEPLIAEDDTNEEILWILRDYFQEELESGQDIDSDEFLSDKFGTDFQKIRDAEAGVYCEK